jgi:hypothetical protein
MAIATGLFVLLATCFVGFVFGIKVNSMVAFATVNWLELINSQSIFEWR